MNTATATATAIASIPDTSTPDARFTAWLRRQVGRPASPTGAHAVPLLAGKTGSITLGTSTTSSPIDRVRGLLDDLNGEPAAAIDHELDTRHVSGEITTVEWGADTIIASDTEYTLLELIDAGRNDFEAKLKGGKANDAAETTAETQDSDDDDSDDDTASTPKPDAADAVAGEDEDGEGADRSGD